MIAPKNFEIRWTQFEDTFAESLTKKNWAKPVLFFLTVVMAYLTFDFWTQSSFPQWSRFNLIQDRLWATYVLIFLSFLPLVIRQLRGSVPFLFIVVSTSWLFPAYKINSLSSNGFLPIVYLVMCSFIVNRSFWNRWLRAFLVLVLFLALVSLLTNNAIDSANGKLLIYFSNLHLDFLLLYYIGAIFNQKSFSNQMHFNPLQLVSPLPLPENSQSLKNEGYELQFTKGILGIFWAQIIFLSLILVLQQPSVFETQNPLIYYFLFIATVIGAMKMASSLLWIYGFKTLPATYFLLLAKSPIEVWQRGSTFVADFLFNKIYLPIWKRTRSMPLASILVVIAVIFHVFFFHEILVKTLLRFQFGNMLFGSFGMAEAIQWGLWVAAWSTWIFVFWVFAKLTKPLHHYSIFQWLLIALTHLGSAMIFPAVLYLASVVRF